MFGGTFFFNDYAITGKPKVTVLSLNITALISLRFLMLDVDVVSSTRDIWLCTVLLLGVV